MPQHNQPVTAKVTTLPPIPNPYATAIAAGAVATPAAAPQSAAAPPPQVPSAGPSSTPAAVLTATQIGSARDKKLAMPQSSLGDDPNAPWQEKVKRLIRELCRTEKFDCVLDAKTDTCTINFQSETIARFFFSQFYLLGVKAAEVATQFVWAKSDFLEWKISGCPFILPITFDNYYQCQVSNFSNEYAARSQVTDLLAKVADGPTETDKLRAADYKSRAEKNSEFAITVDTRAKAAMETLAMFTGVVFSIQNRMYRDESHLRQRFYTFFYNDEKDAEIAHALAKACKGSIPNVSPDIQLSKNYLKIIFDQNHITSTGECYSGDKLLTELLQVQSFPVLWKDSNGISPKLFIKEGKLGICFEFKDDVSKFLDLYPEDKAKFATDKSNDREVFLNQLDDLTPIINRVRVLFNKWLLPQTGLLCSVYTKDTNQLSRLSFDDPWYSFLPYYQSGLAFKEWDKLSDTERGQLFYEVLIKNHALKSVKFSTNFFESQHAQTFDVSFTNRNDAELFCRTFAPMCEIETIKEKNQEEPKKWDQLDIVEKRTIYNKVFSKSSEDDKSKIRQLSLQNTTERGSFYEKFAVQYATEVTAALTELCNESKKLDTFAVKIPPQQMKGIGQCLYSNFPHSLLQKAVEQLQATTQAIAPVAGLAGTAATPTPVGDTATAAAGSDAKDDAVAASKGCVIA